MAALGLALAVLAGSQAIRVSLSRSFVDKWVKTQPDNTLTVLNELSQDPDAPDPLRKEAEFVLGKWTYGATLAFEQLDAGFPFDPEEVRRTSERGRAVLLLGGFAEADLDRVRLALRIELKHLGVPYPHDQQATESWFRTRFGQGSAEWWKDHEPGPVPHSEELNRWLRERRAQLPLDQLDSH